MDQKLPLELANADSEEVSGLVTDARKKNEANVEQIAEIMESLADVFKLRSDKFFMFTTELAELKSVQKEMLELQNRNWKDIQEHFEILELDIRVLRDCDQLLFSRQQIKFNYDTASSLLTVTFANI